MHFGKVSNSIRGSFTSFKLWARAPGLALPLFLVSLEVFNSIRAGAIMAPAIERGGAIQVLREQQLNLLGGLMSTLSRPNTTVKIY